MLSRTQPYDRPTGNFPGTVRRRAFFGALASLPLEISAAEVRPSPAGRRIELEIGGGFGDVREADIRAVLLSAADAIWRHCPDTRWEVPGFHIFRSRTAPIVLHEHRPDGRVAIGLNSEGRHWAQFAFQFAHEFAHALASHAGEWTQRWIGDHGANQWFEEALCETASLFALRAMGRSWVDAPPYPNWKNYAPALTSYAQERLDQSATTLALAAPFVPWFAAEVNSLRQAATQRDKNLVIARQLLPLFEAQPGGWESLTALNLTRERDRQKKFAQHLADWTAAAPASQRVFIAKVAAVFD